MRERATTTPTTKKYLTRTTGCLSSYFEYTTTKHIVANAIAKCVHVITRLPIGALPCGGGKLAHA